MHTRKSAKPSATARWRTLCLDALTDLLLAPAFAAALCGGAVRALPYKWGSGGAERAALLDCAGPEGFDLIVAADCASSGHGTRQLFSPIALARPQAQRSAS